MLFRYAKYIFKFIIQFINPEIFYEYKRFRSSLNYHRFKSTDFTKIKTYRKELLRNHTSIINNVGEGSRIFGKKRTTVSKIAKVAGSNIKKCEILYALHGIVQPEQIIELGTSLGMSTLSLHLKNTLISVTSIEGNKFIYDFTREKLKQFPITLIHGNFKEVLPDLLKNYNEKTLVFVDGDHNYTSTMHYFKLCLNRLNPGSVLVFDDINWSKEMQVTWNNIKRDQSIQVICENFFIGVIEIVQQDKPKQRNVIL